jgi:hypothetical protein
MGGMPKPPTRQVRLPVELLDRVERIRKKAEKAADAAIAETAFVAAVLEDGCEQRERAAEKRSTK